VPPILEQMTKPESVADLLQPLDPLDLPTIAPPFPPRPATPPDAVFEPEFELEPAAEQSPDQDEGFDPEPVVEQAFDPVVLPPVTPPATPPAVPQQAGVSEPESVVEQAFDPVVLPPVTPSVPPPASPPPLAAFEVEPAHEEPEELEEAEEPGVTVEMLAAALAPEPETVPAQPLADAEQEQPQTSSRRERKEARRAADKLAKQAKRTAKQERKALPAAHKRVVGLKVGASQIAAAQVINAGDPRIVRMARMPLERGVVVGGELREPDVLAAALKTFFRKNKLPRNCVRLGISNNRIGVRTFEIPGIEDPKQLGNAIRYRAQETLPIPLDEAVLDYRILEDRVGEDGVRVRRVLLVVAHRDLVDRYVGACRKAGLKLIGIDLEAFALLRALGDPARPVATEDAGLVCISIGHDRSTLAVSDGRICEFTRVLAWGGSSLNIAIARALDLTPSEAEPLKHELSLGEEGEVAGLAAHRADEARRAMAAELQAFARELVASLRFYQEQPGSLGVGEILITGGGAACGGLAAELERLIGVPVHVADPLARVKVPRKLRKTWNGPDGSLAVAVGLGIED
jgi:type IV pilus assembly protein PilM